MQRHPPARDPVRRNAALLVGALLGAALLLRVPLHLSPDTDLDLAGYNVHHLFTGVLLIAAGGIPLALGRCGGRARDVAVVAFGAGLGMALDEWVYLIVTDGSNASYLLPVSLWGALVALGAAALYALALAATNRRGG